MEKLVGYIKVPVYVGDTGEFYTKEVIDGEIVPDDNEKED